jgi:hypothetical protein
MTLPFRPRPLTFTWTCGVVPGHSHATEADAWKCIAAHTKPPIGLCPACGAPGRLRERRPNGNDTCAAGHVYPSRDAIGG